MIDLEVNDIAYLSSKHKRDEAKTALLQARLSLERAAEEIDNYIEKEMELFYNPEEILNGDVDYNEFQTKMKEATDSIYLICYRLVQYLISDKYIFKDSDVKPFQKFIEMDVIPIDTKILILSQFVIYDSESKKTTVNANVRNLIVGSQKIKECYCKLLETYKCTIK